MSSKKTSTVRKSNAIKKVYQGRSGEQGKGMIIGGFKLTRKEAEKHIEKLKREIKYYEKILLTQEGKNLIARGTLYSKEEVETRKKALKTLLKRESGSWQIGDIDFDEIYDIIVRQKDHNGLMVLEVYSLKRDLLRRFAIGTEKEVQKAFMGEIGGTYDKPQILEDDEDDDIKKSFMKKEKAEKIFRSIFNRGNRINAEDDLTIPPTYMEEGKLDPKYTGEHFPIEFQEKMLKICCRLAEKMNNMGIITMEEAQDLTIVKSKIDEYVKQKTQKQIDEGLSGYNHYEKISSRDNANAFLLENDLIDFNGLYKEWSTSPGSRVHIVAEMDPESYYEHDVGEYHIYLLEE